MIFIANREVEQLADIAIAAFDEGKDPSKLKKEVAAVFHGKQAIDIACFGRMLADAPDLNTDASAQVAHAFSIDQITPEYDYFTAVDDCASDDNAGAAMIDTVGFVKVHMRILTCFSVTDWQTSMSLKIPWRTPMRGWMKSIGCC